ncbi:hypothetical protein JTZ62_04755 [Mammaliicoccus sciuri]|uniref:hypothetical protein n=1 Tax=Mammaliicoccus sciuri TaxID=1296 RepID=UPI0019D40224|nr:hypothetical protein [Mammaliicoccus sciuri]QSN68469.1 hypothetical protein JTZ62_04755 [Mammaliicoccus sciuri]UIU23210.1 hypothetical protein LLZ87_04765 [Mammaliicoccus sciuri]UIU26115.1 hypothetical protein LLZ92_04765 [Mammaliicoccus sciuri]
MNNNFKHGDIFYVNNGHWYGLYVNYNNQHCVYMYNPDDAFEILMRKRLETINSYRSIIMVDEDCFEGMVNTHHGNIFDISEEEVEKAKLKYEKVLQTHNKLDKYLVGDDKE